MKNISAGQVRRILCKAIYAGTRCVNKLGDKRADCLAAGGSGDITVGE